MRKINCTMKMYSIDYNLLYFPFHLTFTPHSFFVSTVVKICYIASLFLGFDWSLHFKWDSLTAKEKQARRSQPVAPIRYIVVIHVVYLLMLWPTVGRQTADSHLTNFWELFFTFTIMAVHVYLSIKYQ